MSTGGASGCRTSTGAYVCLALEACNEAQALHCTLALHASLLLDSHTCGLRLTWNAFCVFRSVKGRVDGKIVPIPPSQETVNTLFDANVHSEEEMEVSDGGERGEGDKTLGDAQH